MTRKCQNCGILRSEAHLPNPFTGICKACKSDLARKNAREDPSAKAVAWRKERADRSRAARVLLNYGLTLEEYDAMVVAQEGRCAICRGEMPLEQPLHIDHDHVTEAVRGLLCPLCNTGLGSFGDSPQRLRDAADYLERNRDDVN